MNTVLLREFFDEDIVLLKKWLYFPHVAAWYRAPLAWIREVKNRKEEFFFLHHFIVEVDNKPIGFCQFYEYCHSGETWHNSIDVNGTYSIDYLIGDTDYLRKGYGTAIINALKQIIKVQNNAKRIIVKPESKNKASCNALLASGFFFDKSNQIYIFDL